MSDQPALPPATPSAPADRSGLAVFCATAVILVALGTGGYLLKQELDRLANAKPEAPPEVTKALTDLRTQLDQQQADSATQLHALQNELATLKEQQVAQETPDVDAAIAPVEEKLDALIQQIQEAPASQAEPAADAPVDAVTVAQEAVPAGEPLRDYLSLRRRVESGQPYAAELAALIPHVPESELASISILQEHAEAGIGRDDAEEDAPATAELKPWMQTLNTRLKGLVSIKPSAGDAMTPQARTEVFAALDRIEASLMGAQ